MLESEALIATENWRCKIFMRFDRDINSEEFWAVFSDAVDCSRYLNPWNDTPVKFEHPI